MPYTTTLDTKAQASDGLCSYGADRAKDNIHEAPTTPSRMEALLVTCLLFDVVEETVEYTYNSSDDSPALVDFALKTYTQGPRSVF
jgi:hypothetical protein